MKKYLFSGAFILLLIAFALIPVISNFAQSTVKESKKDIMTVGSYGNLKNLLIHVKDSGFIVYGENTAELGAALDGNIAVKKEKSSSNNLNESLESSDYSSTNIQVEGVDEADMIKTDGEYIYQVNNGRIIVAKAYPTDDMKIVDTIQYNSEQFFPREIYIDNKYMVVIGNTILNNPIPTENRKSTMNRKEIAPSYYRQGMVKAIIYNIEEKNDIKKLRELELEGNYISSRKIGSSLYLIANKFIDTYTILEKNHEDPTPLYRDSINKKDKRLSYNDIHYFPEIIEPNYLLVAGVNLDDMEQEVSVEAYLGAGQNIYASLDHLYVAATKRDVVEVEKGNNKDKNNKTVSTTNFYDNRSTMIYKFKLNQGQMTYMNKGEVPGNVLNQFSMDESNGYFRIATTAGVMWRNDEYTSKNNLYVLDEQLKNVGQIEDIAPGERIYSVRFMGDRAYMVTFKQVDPLFVIDLKNPKSPKILGKLKIPGYSDYLHPYDENHIIGFGKDTIEGKNEKMAYYQGMKIAIFDVSDVNNPKEQFVEIIGDRGTYSELLNNHKALLFSKEKNLLAFPVTVMEVKNKENNYSDIHPYGEFSFQGAYIYHIDLKNGFTLRKRITHLSDSDYKKAGHNWYNSDKNVERIIYINDVIYTISKGMIRANNFDTLNDITSLEIPSVTSYK